MRKKPQFNAYFPKQFNLIWNGYLLLCLENLNIIVQAATTTIVSSTIDVWHYMVLQQYSITTIVIVIFINKQSQLRLSRAQVSQDSNYFYLITISLLHKYLHHIYKLKYLTANIYKLMPQHGVMKQPYHFFSSLLYKSR